MIDDLITLERLAQRYRALAQEARARRDVAERAGDERAAASARADMHFCGGISTGLLIAREALLQRRRQDAVIVAAEAPVCDSAALRGRTCADQ